MRYNADIMVMLMAAMQKCNRCVIQNGHTDTSLPVQMDNVRSGICTYVKS